MVRIRVSSVPAKPPEIWDTEAMDEAKSLKDALRSRIRDFRHELGWTQEELALWVRAQGLDWNRGTLKSIESGTREVPADEFFELVALLPMSLEELFPADWVLELAGGRKVHGGAGLRALLEPSQDATVTPDPVRAKVGMPIARPVTDSIGISDHVEVVHIRGAVGSASAASGTLTITKLADKKAAASLKTTVAEVRKLAQRTWGRDVTAERDARVAQRLGNKDVSRRSLQALRGHVTRELLDELRPKIRRRSKNEPRKESR